MKLLHIGKYYPPFHGGMETYLRDLVEAQVQQGHEVTVLIHNHEWGLLRSKTSIEQPQTGLTLIRQASLRPILFTPLMLGLNRRLKKLLLKTEFDLIHLHAPNPSLFALLFSRSAKRIPWVIRWHSDMVTESSSWLLKALYRLLKPMETALLKKADKILISSQNYIEGSPVLQQFSDRLAVVPLGLQIADIEVAPVTTLINDNHEFSLQLFTLGRLTYYKNHRLLIAAMQDLPTMQLTIAGSGDLAEALHKQINQLQLAKRVQLTGAITEAEKNHYFAQCQVFCLASNDRAESYGMVLLEAMVRNKIILVADTAGSGMQWLANNYNKGFTFAANQESDLVAKLNYIHANYQDIQNQQDEFELTIEHTAAAIDRLYRNLKPRESL